MKLMRWKLLYIFLFIFLIFQTNIVLANNIVVPYEWYRYQGASDSDDKEHDCGPACVAMAIQFIKDTFVPIRGIRNYIGHTGATTSEELKDSLQHWGISYNHLSEGAQNVIDAVNDRNHIVICPVTMSCFGQGLDIDSTSDDPALHYDRYSSFSGGHFIIVKGISDDGNWIIAYDPNVWGSYPYPKYWYSNGEPKGKERYYKLSEFYNAINSRGIEILPESSTIYVPDDYSTIQEAVDAASSGDTIIVRDGTYTENVAVNKDHLTISSENGAEVTVVQTANPNDHVFWLEADNVEISGFTVKGGREGILLRGRYCTISDNNINSNKRGICISSPVYNYATITNNKLSNNEYGIYVDATQESIITENTISSNIYGIYLDGGGYLPQPINNYFYINNFIGNTNSLSGVFLGCYVSDNFWSSPQKITYTYNESTYTNYLGNYFDDYIGEDADNDGIGDTPYIVIDWGGNEKQVHYPLMEPFENYSLIENSPPTVEITSGPSGTIDYNNVTFTWIGSDPDGEVTGYYYGLDDPTPENWTTEINHTFNNVSEGNHIFYVQAKDNMGAISSVISRSFTYMLTFILGDFGSANGGPLDCIVDFEDLMIFALAYGSTPSNPNWNPVCDIAGTGGPAPDGVIDFEDLMVFAMHYGETCADL